MKRWGKLILAATALVFVLCGCQEEAQPEVRQPAPVVYADEQTEIRCFETEAAADSSGKQWRLARMTIANNSTDRMILSSRLCVAVKDSEGNYCEICLPPQELFGECASLDGIIEPGSEMEGCICFAQNGTGEYVISIALDFGEDYKAEFYIR